MGVSFRTGGVTDSVRAGRATPAPGPKCTGPGSLVGGSQCTGAYAIPLGCVDLCSVTPGASRCLLRPRAASGPCLAVRARPWGGLLDLCSPRPVVARLPRQSLEE